MTRPQADDQIGDDSQRNTFTICLQSYVPLASVGANVKFNQRYNTHHILLTNKISVFM